MLYGYLFQLVCTVLPALALSACVNEAPPSQTAIEWNEVAWVGMPGQFTGDTDRLSVLAGKPIRLMVGEFDEAWVRGTETTVGSLESLGISADVDVVPGQGHVLTLFDVDLMNWIDAAIGYEER
jgi:hypothetical protein